MPHEVQKPSNVSASSSLECPSSLNYSTRYAILTCLFLKSKPLHSVLGSSAGTWKGCVGATQTR